MAVAECLHSDTTDCVRVSTVTGCREEREQSVVMIVAGDTLGPGVSCGQGTGPRQTLVKPANSHIAHITNHPEHLKYNNNIATW